MWKNAVLILLLNLFAFTAQASSLAQTAPDYAAESVSYSISIDDFFATENSAFHSSVSSDDKQPQSRLSRVYFSLFSAHAQLNPDYFLQHEFFAEQTDHRHHNTRHLIPSVARLKWYETIVLSPQSGRIGGWKDSNCLYKSNLTYHS